jgi:hypothetical protein
VINGPFGPYGHGSILPVIEIITRHVEKLVTKFQQEDIKSFMPRQEAVDEFRRHRELFLKRTAWSSPCRSWFKGGKTDGPILMWPGSRLHFFRALQNPRFEVIPPSLRCVGRTVMEMITCTDWDRIINGSICITTAFRTLEMDSVRRNSTVRTIRGILMQCNCIVRCCYSFIR